MRLSAIPLPSACLCLLTATCGVWVRQSLRWLPGLSPLSSAHRWARSLPNQLSFPSQIEIKPCVSLIFYDVSCGKGINCAQAKGKKKRKERDGRNNQLQIHGGKQPWGPADSASLLLVCACLHVHTCAHTHHMAGL